MALLGAAGKDTVAVCSRPSAPAASPAMAAASWAARETGRALDRPRRRDRTPRAPPAVSASGPASEATAASSTRTEASQGSRARATSEAEIGTFELQVRATRASRSASSAPIERLIEEGGAGAPSTMGAEAMPERLPGQRPVSP